MKKTLWTRNFTLVTLATTLGAAGGIAGSFALSFLVYEETGSTLAAAVLIALQIVPFFILPLFAAPIMDHMPRKPFLVGGDLVNGVMYTLAGVYLLNNDFTYVGYLFFSLLLSSLGSFDSLAYNSIYPKLIPEGMEDKGYSVSSMIYPVMQAIMAPVAALMYSSFGVGNILLLQGGLSLLAALMESRIRITEEVRRGEHGFSIRQWRDDIRETAAYLKNEKGLQNLYAYIAVTNGVSSSYSPLLVAFFTTMPGLSMTMYSLFSVAEFAGRSLGGLMHYHIEIPPKRRFSFAYMVYMLYEMGDMMLLWLPYPLMLVNRAVCGFLGINSATLRQAAVQRYIPEEQRARINAFQAMLVSLAMSVFALLIGALGDVMDLRLCLTVCGGFNLLVCILTIWRKRKAVRAIYNKPSDEQEPQPATTEA